MKPADRLLAVASAEVGYLEKRSNSQLDDKTANAGSNNYTKYARDLDRLGVYNTPKNGYAWCDIFADWCFVQAFGLNAAMEMTGQKMGGVGAGCGGSANYYKSIGRFYKYNPQPGDQIFFSDGRGGMAHTGLVERVAKGRVHTIEGNTSGASGVVANGGGVCRKSYSLSYDRIAGYGRPKFEIVEMEDDDMDVGRFKELWLEMRKDLKDNDASAYSKDARDWAVSTGLIEGGAKEFNGMWEDFMTREQLVTVLYRFAKQIGKA